MRKINSKKFREKWFFILAFITLLIAFSTLILGIATLNLQKATNPTTKPEIIIELYDSSNFAVWDVSAVSSHTDGRHSLKSSFLNFKISNLGLKDADYVNFHAKDPTGEYGFNTEHLDNLYGLDDEFFQIEFFSSECREAYIDAQDGEEFDFDYAWDKCKEIRTNLTEGSKEIILRLNCPGCEFGKKYQCYSFEMCIYEDSEEVSCGEDLGYQKVKERETCPENWYR